MSHLLTPDADNFLSKAFVFHCVFAFCRIGEYISPDLFYFVDLTSSCSLIPRHTLVSIWFLLTFVKHRDVKVAKNRL